MNMTTQSRFQSVLGLQWKSSRLMILLTSIVAFALPIMSVNVTRAPDVRVILRAMEGWSIGYTVLAGALGLIVALGAWAPDHRGRHVYALALPMSRWRFVALKYSAGLVCLLPAVVTLLVGSLVAVKMATVPAGLHAYPGALTIRFALAVLVAFSVFFAISSATPRTAGAIMITIVALIFVQYVLTLSGSRVNLVGKLTEAFFATKGAFGVFTARWMLIDV
jgi:hypothetical protein